MSRRDAATLLEALAGVDLAGAACTGRLDLPWVDVDPALVDDMLRICRSCPVVAACRSYGDSLAPHRDASVFGARMYGRDEPLDGWAVA